MDNGSLQPAATLGLRELSSELDRWAAEEIGVRVEPASLLHSSKVDPALLGGVRAEVVYQAVKRNYRAGVRDFRILPLFIGPSRALTEYLPERLEVWQKEFPEMRLRIGEPLYRRGDDRLARILIGQIIRAGGGEEGWRRVVLTDHGSPEPKVAEVRNAIAAEVGQLLPLGPWQVRAASMERRPGPEYAFNEPLLETVLRDPDWRGARVLVAMLFLLPGRHAGPGGDVASICAEAEGEGHGLETKKTGLLGEDPLLMDILKDRLRELYSSSREAR